MSPDAALLDTNILAYALYEDAEYHKPCRSLLDRAQDAEAASVVAQVRCSQSLTLAAILVYWST
jgi:predicted nucleic acid-binding protein